MDAPLIAEVKKSNKVFCTLISVFFEIYKLKIFTELFCSCTRYESYVDPVSPISPMLIVLMKYNLSQKLFIVGLKFVQIMKALTVI